MPISDRNRPKIIKVIFNFPRFASACKKLPELIDLLLQYSKCYDLKGSTPTFDNPNPNINYVLNLYHHKKNQFILLIHL